MLNKPYIFSTMFVVYINTFHIFFIHRFLADGALGSLDIIKQKKSLVSHQHIILYGCGKLDTKKKVKNICMKFHHQVFWLWCACKYNTHNIQFYCCWIAHFFSSFIYIPLILYDDGSDLFIFLFKHLCITFTLLC